jgi:tungstate transport system substrate-binding protein
MKRLLLALMLLALPAQAQERFITVASTTSTDQSGLFGHLLPRFQQASGIAVRIVALGTGQALDVGRRGDADVVFVHDKPAEEKFVADGFGVARIQVMYNDFVVIGPKADPARIKDLKDVTEALRRVQRASAPFVSRGDRSGTHAAELRYWQDAGVQPAGAWYREVGQGMGPALNTASAMNAYILADRGTWLNFRNRGELDILVQGDERLFNQYGVIMVNPQRHAHVKAELGRIFIAWLTGPDGQRAIADYKIGGEQLFFPNAAARATRS